MKPRVWPHTVGVADSDESAVVGVDSSAVVLNVRERPILFSSPMVRAILDGRKTQTRRIVKPQPERYEAGGGWGLCWGKKNGGGSEWMDKWCPYGTAGDRLFVREGLHRPDGDPWLYKADNRPVMIEPADETAMVVWAHHKKQDYCSSMFMPRWASRITLELAAIRVERLQEITEADVEDEGCSDRDGAGPYPSAFGGRRIVNNYAALWKSIHGAGSWAENPWVWVLSFKRVDSVASTSRSLHEQGAQIGDLETKTRGTRSAEGVGGQEGNRGGGGK